MKRLLYVTAALLLFSSVAAAQEHNQNRIHIAFASSDYELNKGVNIGAQRAIYRYDKVKVEAAAEATTYFYEGRRIHTLQAGPQVSVDLFEAKLTLGARAFFGASKDGHYYDYSHLAGVFADVNVTEHFFIRGAQDRQTFGSGVGYRTTVGFGYSF